ncbi:MAG TPA: patatin-like phospholipase family protein [Aquifex aeolicus]|nr:patatin-like phospholipase family protein [Aquifex aeolicus]
MKINLVLSGGAARGIAHIGVIKALEDMGFSIEAVSGSSAGALVGVFYAGGYSPEDMLALVKETRWFSLLKPGIPRRGLFSFSKAQATLEELLGVQRLEDLGKKVYVCVTDLLSGRTLYLSEGDIVPMILGSCALPGVFEPVRYGNYVFIDGGITNNLPVEPFERSSFVKVGVDVNPMGEVSSVGTMVHVLVRSFFLALRSNADKRRELCDVLIEPDLLGYSPLNVRKADELYALGYEKTTAVMERFLGA